MCKNLLLSIEWTQLQISIVNWSGIKKKIGNSSSLAVLLIVIQLFIHFSFRKKIIMSSFEFAGPFSQSLIGISHNFFYQYTIRNHEKLSQWPAVVETIFNHNDWKNFSLLSLQCLVNIKSILVPPESEFNFFSFFFCVWITPASRHTSRTSSCFNAASKFISRSIWAKKRLFFIRSFCSACRIHTYNFLSLCVIRSVHVFSGLNHTKIDW